MVRFIKLFSLNFRINLRYLDAIVFGVIFPVFVFVLTLFLTGGQLQVQEVMASSACIGICATGIMGISTNISEMRQRKILKKYQVSPISTSSILAIQVLGNLIISLTSLLLIYLCGKIFFQLSLNGHGLQFILLYLYVFLTIHAIGFVLASISPNLRISNLLTTIIYFPMLFLSGATIPYEVMPTVMQKVVAFLPLTQGIFLLKNAVLGLPVNLLALIVLGVTFVICSIVAKIFFKWE